MESHTIIGRNLITSAHEEPGFDLGIRLDGNKIIAIEPDDDPKKKAGSSTHIDASDKIIMSRSVNTPIHWLSSFFLFIQKDPSFVPHRSQTADQPSFFFPCIPPALGYLFGNLFIHLAYAHCQAFLPDGNDYPLECFFNDLGLTFTSIFLSHSATFMVILMRTASSVI